MAKTKVVGVRDLKPEELTQRRLHKLGITDLTDDTVTIQGRSFRRQPDSTPEIWRKFWQTILGLPKTPEE